MTTELLGVKALTFENQVVTSKYHLLCKFPLRSYILTINKYMDVLIDVCYVNSQLEALVIWWQYFSIVCPLICKCMTLSILSQLSQKLDYYDYYLYVTSPPSKVSPRSITPYHCYIPPNLWPRYKFLNIFWHSFSFKAWKVNSLSIKTFKRWVPSQESTLRRKQKLIESDLTSWLGQLNHTLQQ